jgi:hypothetical protein
MKKLLLLFALTVPALAKAQITDALPIPLDGVWQIAWRALIISNDQGTYSYRINGEVSVNDTIYHNVEQFSYCDPTVPATPALLIREDSSKWYTRYNALESEMLMFDFSLDVGDSITTESCWGFFEAPQTLIVTSIDTITMYDGSARRRWSLVYGPTSDLQGNEEFWIEGIGNAYTWLYHSMSHSCVDINAGLHCFFESDVRKFPSTEFPIGIDCCNPFSVEEMSTSAFSIFPSPATDQTSIQFEAAHIPQSIQIFNATGQLLHTENVLGRLQMQLNVLEYAKGIYTVRGRFENGEEVSERLVVE